MPHEIGLGEFDTAASKRQSVGSETWPNHSSRKSGGGALCRSTELRRITTGAQPLRWRLACEIVVLIRGRPRCDEHWVNVIEVIAKPANYVPDLWPDTAFGQIELPRRKPRGPVASKTKEGSALLTFVEGLASHSKHLRYLRRVQAVADHLGPFGRRQHVGGSTSTEPRSFVRVQFVEDRRSRPKCFKECSDDIHLHAQGQIMLTRNLWTSLGLQQSLISKPTKQRSDRKMITLSYGRIAPLVCRYKNLSNHP